MKLTESSQNNAEVDSYRIEDTVGDYGFDEQHEVVIYWFSSKMKKT